MKRLIIPLDHTKADPDQTRAALEHFFTAQGIPFELYRASHYDVHYVVDDRFIYEMREIVKQTYGTVGGPTKQTVNVSIDNGQLQWDFDEKAQINKATR